MITPEQIRRTHVLFGMTQAQLAELPEISATGLNNIERGRADPKSSTLQSIQSVMERQGMVFLSTGESRTGGPGIRLEKRNR